jgi:hypothetical protein
MDSGFLGPPLLPGLLVVVLGCLAMASVKLLYSLIFLNVASLQLLFIIRFNLEVKLQTILLLVEVSAYNIHY